MILVLAAGWVAVRERGGVAVALTGTALAASLAALLVGGAPLSENLAYVIDGYRVPADSSWGYVFSNYPGQLAEVIGEDLTYPFDFRYPLPMLFAMALFFAGCIALVCWRRGDRYFTLMRAALGGGFLTILISANFTVWRLELALLPAAAVGMALLVERILPALQSRLRGADKRREIRPTAAVAEGE